MEGSRLLGTDPQVTIWIHPVFHFPQPRLWAATSFYQARSTHSDRRVFGEILLNRTGEDGTEHRQKKHIGS